MKVTMILADAAQVSEGKLHLLGGGWSNVSAGVAPFAIGMIIDVPWDDTNRDHKWELKLFDEDNKPFEVPTPAGNKPFILGGSLKVGRPPEHIPGTPIGVPLALSFALPFTEPGRYVWKLNINDETKDDWQLAFNVRGKKKPLEDPPAP